MLVGEPDSKEEMALVGEGCFRQSGREASLEGDVWTKDRVGLGQARI